MFKRFYPCLLAISIYSCGVSPHQVSHKKYSYIVVVKDKMGNVENYDIQLTAQVRDSASVDSMLHEVKDELCQGKCNLSAYDDSSYALMEQRYNEAKNALSDSLTSGLISKSQFKKRTNEQGREFYLPIAEHFIAWIDFDDNFYYDPYKDWFYKELKTGVGRK